MCSEGYETWFVCVCVCVCVCYLSMAILAPQAIGQFMSEKIKKAIFQI